MLNTGETTDNTLNKRRIPGRLRASVYSRVYKQKFRIHVLLQFDNRSRRRGCLHRRCIGCGHFLAAFLDPNTISRPSPILAAARPDRSIFLFGRALSFRLGHADLYRTERKAESRTTAPSAVARRVYP